MRTHHKARLGATGLTALALAGAGCGKSGGGANPDLAIKSAASIMTAPAAPDAPLAVNDLAASPGAHLGPVALIGVVGTVDANKSFVVVDTREYAECGLSCLVEAGTKKIPVRWAGAAPQVKDKVRIEGQLTKEAKGFALVAAKVVKQ